MLSYSLVDDRKLVRLEREAVAIDQSVRDEAVCRGEVRLNVRSAGAAAEAGDDAAAHHTGALRQGGTAGVLAFFWELLIGYDACGRQVIS